MPNGEKIELLISPEALKQFEQLKSVSDANTASFEKLIAKAVELNKAVGNATTFKELNKATADMTKVEGELAKAKADLLAIQERLKKAQDDEKNRLTELEKQKAKLNKLYTGEAKEIAEVKAQQQQRNKELRDEAKLQSESVGAFQKLSIALDKLKSQYKDLVTLGQDNTAEGQRLKAEIDDMQKVFEKANISVKDFRFNVGNYQGSAKIIVDALERAKDKFNALSKAADTTPAALARARSEFDALRQVTESKQFLNYGGKLGDAQAEVKTFTRVLVGLESQGEGNSEAAKELRQRLAELTDQIADTKAEVKALSSDTRSFDLFASSISFAADVFQTAAGAAVAFGASEEDAAEATKTLLAIQNISNGVKGIANELTTRGTAANKLYSFSQQQVSIAIDSSATAAARLRAALITVGIGALVIGIGLLVTNFSKLKDSFSRLSDSQKLLNNINKEAIQGFVQEKVQIESLVREVNNENTSKTRKKEIIKELNNISPTYFAGIKTEKDLQDKLSESVAKYIRAIQLKAKAKAAENALVAAETPIIEREIELQRQLDALQTKTFDTEARKQRSISNLKKTIETGTDQILVELNKRAAPIRSIIANINTELDSIGGDPKKQTETTKTSKKFFDDLLKADADMYKKLSENDDAYLSTRLSARNKAFEIEKKILAGQRKAEIDNAEGNTQTIAQIRQDFANKTILAERKLAEDIVNIRQTFIVKQREQEQQDRALFEDNPDAEINALKKTLERRVSFLSAGRDAELTAIENKRAKGLISEEEYQRKRLGIENSYAALLIKAEIDYTEEVLRLAKLRGEDTASAEAQLAALKLKYSQTTNAQITEDNKIAHDKEKELLEQKKQMYKDLGTQILDVFNAVVTGGYDRQIAAIQAEIDKLEEQKNKEIEVANATIANKDERELAIAKIEARSQAQREQLENRQKQIELQKAKFEKAAALLSIAIDTTQKVAAIKAQAALLAANPVTAALAPLALSMIPVVITAGALAAGLIAARPLPKFADGTDDAPGGLSWVGDGGKKELVITPQGQVIQTPAVPTVMNVPRHSIVLPDARAALESGLAVNRHGRLVQNENGDIKEVGRKIDTLTKVMRNKPTLNMNADQGGLTAMWQYGANWVTYADDQTRF